MDAAAVLGGPSALDTSGLAADDLGEQSEDESAGGPAGDKKRKSEAQRWKDAVKIVGSCEHGAVVARQAALDAARIAAGKPLALTNEKRVRMHAEYIHMLKYALSSAASKTVDRSPEAKAAAKAANRSMLDWVNAPYTFMRRRPLLYCYIAVLQGQTSGHAVMEGATLSFVANEDKSDLLLMFVPKC